MAMSPELREALKAAGWSADRRVPIDAWVAELREGGFSIVPEAEEILRNFGGLTVEPVRRLGDPIAPATVVFDPLALAERELVEHWEAFLGKKLTPLGEIGHEASLLVADDGEVYTAWERFLFKEADSFEEALDETLVFGRREHVEVGSIELDEPTS